LNAHLQEEAERSVMYLQVLNLIVWIILKITG